MVNKATAVQPMSTTENTVTSTNEMERSKAQMCNNELSSLVCKKKKKGLKPNRNYVFLKQSCNNQVSLSRKTREKKQRRLESSPVINVTVFN